jgi:hypothetical protein
MSGSLHFLRARAPLGNFSGSQLFQRAAISKLKEQDASHDKEEALLASLLKSHEMLVKHLDHIQRLGLVRSPDT